MQYTITWIENGTTSTGKVKATATLLGSDGIVNENVTIWGDFPNFNELRPAGKVEGTIQVKQNGQYTNKTLYPAQVPKKGNFAIKEAQATKREDIAHAQDRKEESIKEASIFRDATILTSAYVTKQNLEVSFDTIKNTWVEFRKWLKEQQDLPF